MDGLMRGIFLLCISFTRFLAKLALMFALGTYAVHFLQNKYGPEFKIKISSAGSAPAILISNSQNVPAFVKPAGIGFPSDEPAEWVKKFLARIQKARKEVAQKARKELNSNLNPSGNKASHLNPTKELLAPTYHKRQALAERRAKAPPRKISLAKSFQEGIASFYGRRWNGRKTANGEIFNSEKLTAAHKTLPFGTFVRVVRKDNGRSVVVRINDRGPFKPGRIIDLSAAGARRLDMVDEGLTKVSLYPATLVDFLKQFEN